MTSTTRIASLFLSLLIGILFTWMTISVVSSITLGPVHAEQFSSAIHYVASDGNCGSESPCYPTIQAAVDAAASGDEVRVAAGEYTDLSVRPRIDLTTTGSVTQVVYITKTTIIRGGYTTTNWLTPDPIANLTILNAQGQGRGLYISGDISATIESLYITNGNAEKLGGLLTYNANLLRDVGGGIYAITATVTISNNEIVSNTVANNIYSSPTSSVGGGLYIVSSDSTVAFNLVHDNGGYCNAGAYLRGSNLIVQGNSFTDNRSSGGQCYIGGGLSIDGDSNIIQDNLFTGNYSYAGGGVGVGGNSIVANNTIAYNTAIYGGGIQLLGGAVVLKGNTIIGNEANQAGGGISTVNCKSPCTPVLINNVIVRNVMKGGSSFFLGGGSAILASSAHMELLNNTIVQNSSPYEDGSGIFVSYGAVTLTNNIIVQHTVGISVSANSIATMNATLWGIDSWANQQDWAGAGTIITGAINIWGNPSFIDDFNFGLTHFSDAIDQGVSAYITDDIDGDSRPQGCGLDIGADELTGQVCSIPITGGHVRGPGYEVTIPDGAFTDTVILTATTLMPGSLPAITPTLSHTGNQFDLTVVYSSTNQPAQLVAGQVYTLATWYNDTSLNEIVENTIALYYWDGNQWRKESAMALDTIGNSVIATPNHFSIWALFGDKKDKIYLPLITR